MRPLLAILFLPLIACAEPQKTTPWVDLLADDSLVAWGQIRSETSSEAWNLKDGDFHLDETPSEAWNLKDGVLHLDKSLKIRGGYLYTKKKYQNFELKFDWKISDQGNSGVKYRINDKGVGIEYQIIDDSSKAAHKPSYRAGSFYDLLAAPDDKPIHKVGEWNKSRIVANGNQLEHWLNGVKILEIEYLSDEWNERFKKSKYREDPTFASTPGPIFLQDHGDDVWYRNVLIKELP